MIFVMPSHFKRWGDASGGILNATPKLRPFLLQTAFCTQIQITNSVLLQRGRKGNSAGKQSAGKERGRLCVDRPVLSPGRKRFRTPPTREWPLRTRGLRRRTHAHGFDARPVRGAREHRDRAFEAPGEPEGEPRG